ncbi:hypothetical protein CC86DRAFT_368019 [Ophiobolus disseminans]|uniref:Uncharacterized protein n=1 Tax=Ophiobolus disseminans TaxID=1469910 RepID=A0A6A7AA28_9PLEO|nr:hypothetical protein CC86DRAFT_368019 [Ophiobolus disseminans]
MDETRPFLASSKAGSNHDTMFVARGGKRRTAFFFYARSSVCTHLVVFVGTSITWAVALLLLNYFAPLTQPGPATRLSITSTPVTLSQPHGHGFLATETEYLTCGTSLAEAKQRKCVYDILSNAWIPSLCSDETFVREYQSDGTWFPFADANHTQPLKREELGDVAKYYTNMRDHIVHCSVLWKRQFMAWKEGWKYLDDVLVDEHHTFHCADFLVEMTDKGVDFREQPIGVVVGHVGCHVRSG